MNDKHGFIIKFENTTPVEANQLAEELNQRLSLLCKGVCAELHKPDPHTMDLGTELFISFVQDVAVNATVAAVMAHFFREKGGNVYIFVVNVYNGSNFLVKNASEEMERELGEFLGSDKE